MVTVVLVLMEQNIREIYSEGKKSLVEEKGTMNYRLIEYKQGTQFY